MPKHDEAHGRLQTAAMAPEKLLPLVRAHQLDQLRIGANDERAAFIEDGEEIAQAAALALLVRDRGGMQGVDARLGAREGKPAKGVEPIVQVVGARLDAPRVVHAQLIGAARRGWRHELDLATALRANAGRYRVQVVERLEPEPARERRVDRMS